LKKSDSTYHPSPRTSGETCQT